MYKKLLSGSTLINIRKQCKGDIVYQQLSRLYTTSTLDLDNNNNNSKRSTVDHINKDSISHTKSNNTHINSTLLNSNNSNSIYKSNSSKIKKDSKIYLSKAEKEIIDFVCNVPKLINRDDIVIRIAGGWVRDKLINKNESTIYDLDFALENISGEEFVKLLSQYIGGRTFITKMNPSKSKHLETACLEIDGFSLEFNALRTDQYTQHTRIPVIIRGTPKEDAMRRDITINCLFYNLNTKEIEDQTGMGIDDLEQGIIRTPLCPEATLNDDPLRALRAIRFSSRLNFKIEPTLYKVIQSNEIKELVSKKVSKERILIEYTKMMSDTRFSLQYYKYLVETGLIQVIFNNSSLHYSDSIEFFKNGTTVLKPSKRIESLEYFTTLIFMNDFVNGTIDINGVSKLLKEFKSSNKTSREIQSHLLTIRSIVKVINTFIIKQQQHNFSLDQFLIDEFNSITFGLLESLKGDDLWETSIHLSRVYLTTTSKGQQQQQQDNLILSGKFWNSFTLLLKDKYQPISKSAALATFGDISKAKLPVKEIGDIMKQLFHWQWRSLCQGTQPTQSDALVYLKTIFLK
ncbi:hypothetical protein CYY_007131 [Polysphondylium violaceum]|uniref:tRNA nucleotidyltransferase n=1 Tax=Polysphondylium violaceum TaxID=133409 RepID=A0A8J4PQ12_9MYCE|nr:hypothetical protein CYY_007131 [Polysphondylium violaceum]